MGAIWRVMDSPDLSVGQPLLLESSGARCGINPLLQGGDWARPRLNRPDFPGGSNF